MAIRRLYDPTTLGPNLHMKKVEENFAKLVVALCQHSFRHLLFW